MLNIKYDRLEYVGISKSFTLDILPSRRRVTITSSTPYKFREGDSQDEASIKYYNSLYNAGIRLVESTDNTEIKEVIEKEEIPAIDNEVSNTTENEEAAVEESSDNEEVTAEVIENNKEEEVETPVVNEEETDATESEMIEFLDLTFDESSLRGIAKDVGIKRVQSSWDKSTLISKIIEYNASYVVNLIKNS